MELVTEDIVGFVDSQTVVPVGILVDRIAGWFGAGDVSGDNDKPYYEVFVVVVVGDDDDDDVEVEVRFFAVDIHGVDTYTVDVSEGVDIHVEQVVGVDIVDID